MTATQRRARADIRRLAVKVEIDLGRAARASEDRWRDYYLGHAQHNAGLALHFAPSTQPLRGAA